WRCQPQDRWRMVPVERYPATEVAAWWYRDTVVYPAITRYNYGRGRAVLLSSSYLLHPANGGGWLGAADIDDFYEELVVTLTRPRDSGMALSLHPWPNAAPYALCVTLDAEGTLPAFENAVNLLQGLGVSPVFYVNAHLDPGVAAAVRDRGFTLHSKGFDPVYAGAQDCHGIRLNILRNELHWRTRFTGYRFPQGFPSFLGLQALCRLGYVFDNSVAVDNVDELKGSVVPYNLPLNNTGFEVPPPPASLYLSSDLLEISPIQKDDYYFFRRLVNADDYPAGLMRRDAEVYTRHLQTFLRTAVKPYRGVASYVGRVSNTGHNETTLQPLREMVRTALRDTAWIAPIDSIAWYRNKIGSLRLTVREKERIVEISMQVRGSGEVPGLTLRVAARPAALSVVEGPAKLLRRDDAWYVVCTGSDRQIVTLRF
ncbi:MAG: hypothetical protein JXA71_17410, partial [Chitinispirillaceae bacterium]|nr:hypothetical protein [Chitinispirillaceae bacterium]